MLLKMRQHKIKLYNKNRKFCLIQRSMREDKNVGFFGSVVGPKAAVSIGGESRSVGVVNNPVDAASTT